MDSTFWSSTATLINESRTKQTKLEAERKNVEYGSPAHKDLLASIYVEIGVRHGIETARIRAIGHTRGSY